MTILWTTINLSETQMELFPKKINADLIVLKAAFLSIKLHSDLQARQSKFTWLLTNISFRQKTAKNY